MFETVLLVTLFVILCIASVSDFKTREVPDFVSFGAIACAFGLRALYSAISWDYLPLLAGILGFIVFYLFGYIMFYTGQWGGGDSKILMAIGAFLGLDLYFENKVFAFFVSLVITGAIYGIVWSFVLAIKNRKSFFSNVKKLFQLKKYIFARRITLLASIFFFLASFFVYSDKVVFVLFMFLAVSSILFFYLFIFVKSVENCCMLKWVEPEVLTEGDWIAKDVVVAGKKICGPKDLGISKIQIKKLMELSLNGKIKKVLLKTGIPFVPSFLLALLFMQLFGNILLKFL